MDKLEKARSYFKGATSREKEWLAIQKAKAILGEPLTAEYGEGEETCVLTVSEFADEFQGETIAELKFIEYPELKEIIG